MKNWERFVKRTVDVIVSVLGIVACLPIFILISMLVKLNSSGPALFVQMRMGLNGRAFKTYKFRTMLLNAPDIRNADGSAFSSNIDPRVTSVGKWLRKTSLDELPQFFNVLFGEMSLVGPRPDLVDQIRFYTESEKQRLNVKPGITGLAQISGRNSISWESRKQLDIQYVIGQSLTLDAEILVRTIPYVLCGRDVYVSQTS